MHPVLLICPYCDDNLQKMQTADRTGDLLDDDTPKSEVYFQCTNRACGRRFNSRLDFEAYAYVPVFDEEADA